MLADFFQKTSSFQDGKGSWNHGGFSIRDFHKLNIFSNLKNLEKNLHFDDLISLCWLGAELKKNIPRYAEGVDVAKVPADVLSSVCSEVGALEVVLGRTAQPQKFWDFLVPEILRWQHKNFMGRYPP